MRVGAEDIAVPDVKLIGQVMEGIVELAAKLRPAPPAGIHPTPQQKSARIRTRRRSRSRRASEPDAAGRGPAQKAFRRHCSIPLGQRRPARSEPGQSIAASRTASGAVSAMPVDLPVQPPAKPTAAVVG